MRGERVGLRWQCGTARHLGLSAFHAMLELRADVFIVEQQCAYADIDGRDLLEGVRHLLCWRDKTLLACARLLPPLTVYDGSTIGRVVVARQARGHGLAHELIRRSINECYRRWPTQDIWLGAQAHLQHFYAAHGFVRCSEDYLEDGIAHLDMRRCVQAPPTRG